MSRLGKMGAWVFIALAMATASCTKENAPAPDNKSTAGSASDSSSQATGSVILSAAASTKEAIEAITQKFHDETSIEVKVNLGGSNALAAQILAARLPMYSSLPINNGPTKLKKQVRQLPTCVC